MTEGTKNELLSITESKIIEMTSSIDEVRGKLKMIENAQKRLSEKNIILNLENTISLLEYRLFVGLLILDLASTMRAYLNAKFKYEAIFAARQIIVIIKEGYKKIYNFISQNSQGAAITRNRNNSFWIKNIGRIIQKDLPNLQLEYDYLTNKLDNYLANNLNDIKYQRDLFIHYDDHPAIVYDSLLTLDIDQTFRKLTPFLEILNNMFAFTNRLIFEYKEKLGKQNKSFETTVDDLILKLEANKKPETIASISKVIDNLNDIKNIFIKQSPNT